jgi:hypothetical protein
VHFRNCAEAAWEDVQAAVQATLAEQPELRVTRGRKVLELRPEVEWDKGHALAHLLGALGLDGADDVLPIYIGDDRTDEDAFRLLSKRQQGFGILVSSRAKPTDAKYTLRDPAEVMVFLQRLVAWGLTPDNAWHTARSCNGWKLDADAANAAGVSSADSAGSVLTALAASVPQLGPNEVHLSSVPEAASTAAVPGGGEAAMANGGESSTEAVTSSRHAALDITTSWEMRSSGSDAPAGTGQAASAAAGSEQMAAGQPPTEAPDGLPPPHTAEGTAAAEQPAIPRNGFGSHASAASAAAAAKFAGF